MLAVVVGGAGFIGTHLSLELIRQGHDLRIVDDMSGGATARLPWDAVFLNRKAEYNLLMDAFWRADVVFHLAATPDLAWCEEHPDLAVRNNTMTVAAALRAALACRVPRFIYASSWMVYGGSGARMYSEGKDYGSPETVYGLTKLAGEVLVEHYSDRIASASLRLFNVYGPGSEKDVIGAFVGAAGKGEPLVVRGGLREARDFVHVKDVVRAFSLTEYILREELGNLSGMRINVGSGYPIEILEVARLVARLTGAKVRRCQDEGPHRRPAAFIVKARDVLNWTPQVGLKEGVEEMLNNLTDRKTKGE